MGKKKRKKENVERFMPKVEKIFEVRHARKKNKIRANIASWSGKSRRSYGCYEGYEYEDKKYRCRKCDAEEVFTAEEQQYAYEVEKRYIWQDRVLCRNCFYAAGQLKGKLKERLERWEQEKDELCRDVEFLAGWYKELDRFHQYGLRGYDSAKMQMIKKLLGSMNKMEANK